MDEKKLTHDQIKEMTDSPVTKIMRSNLGMNTHGTYANKDYPGRDTKKQAVMQREMMKSPWARDYIQKKAQYEKKKANLDLYRLVTRGSMSPIVNQITKNKISKKNNELAKEKLALHNHPWQFKGEDDPNRAEVISKMVMATGKPNLGLNPTDHAKSGNNVNSDVFKNKWDGKDW